MGAHIGKQLFYHDFLIKGMLFAAQAGYQGPLMMEYAMGKVAFGMQALRDAYGAQGYDLHALKL